jgi:protein-tyrosine phosphatase
MSPLDTPARRVLVICTANVCRSPVAERALEREWAANDVPAVVRSAGITGGQLRVHRYTIEAAGFAKIDLTDHRSRQLDAAMVDTEGADLIIGMTRDHVHTIVARHPSCRPRAFTLRELARRTEELPHPPADWDQWLAACDDGRDPSALLTPDPIDDLPDPYGHDASAHILMVQEVTMHARTIAAAASSPDSSWARP